MDESRKFTPGQRYKYWFDRLMSKGAIALVGWLALMTVLLVVIFSLAIWLGGWSPPIDNSHKPGFGFQLFSSLLHALDPGTIGNEAINNSGVSWIFLFLTFGTTLGGILIVSALIGVIFTGLEARLENLRKGRSLVVEEGHILVLGWSTAVFSILSELAIANESESKSCVVILADHDKVEIEDQLRERVDMKKTRLVVRRGVPTDPNDLAIVNPKSVRTVIITADEAADADAEVVKSVLALAHARDGDASCPIVAVISDPENLDAAKLAGGDRTIFIDKRETIAKLLVQASRQAGMSAVYTELLDFDGDEIYTREDASLTGKPWSDVLFAYDNAAAIGVVSGGVTTLNPPQDYVLQAGDLIVAVAEDDSVLEVATPFTGDRHAELIVEPVHQEEPVHHVLLLGWNSGTASIIQELDGHVPPGSRALLVSEFPEARADLDERCSDLRNLELSYDEGQTSQRRTLARLDVGQFDHIMVLAYSDHVDNERADAKSIMTLLHLRELLAKTGARPSLVSEILEERNRKLAQVAQVDDVVVSDRLVSLLVSQLAESPILEPVFTELFGAGGAEIHLRPASEYVQLGVPVSFATMVEAARRRGETAMGYRATALSEGDTRTFGVRVNPVKSESIVFGPDDAIVVLGRELGAAE